MCKLDEEACNLVCYWELTWIVRKLLAVRASRDEENLMPENHRSGNHDRDNGGKQLETSGQLDTVRNFCTKNGLIERMRATCCVGNFDSRQTLKRK